MKFVFMFVAILAISFAVFVDAYNHLTREYTILIARTPAPAQIIGRIQVGLTKAEAEGAAFQLNELFSKEKLEWKAVASLPEAIK